MYLCLYFLPLFQVQTVLVSLLVTVKFLQLLRQGSSSFTGFFLQTMVLLDLVGTEEEGVVFKSIKPFTHTHTDMTS